MQNESSKGLDLNGARRSADGGATDEPIASERSMATLVNGIIADVQHLIAQQLAMFRQEIQDELRKGLYAVIALALAAGVSAVGGVMLLLMVPLLLHYLVPALPLWACLGIVGGVLAVVGGGFAFVGVWKIRSCHPLSNPAVEAFKENFQWSTHPK
jgi:hypothetical protein